MASIYFVWIVCPVMDRPGTFDVCECFNMSNTLASTVRVIAIHLTGLVIRRCFLVSVKFYWNCLIYSCFALL